MKIITISIRAFVAKWFGIEASYTKVTAPDGCAKDSDIVEGEFTDVMEEDRMIESQTDAELPEMQELSKRKK